MENDDKGGRYKAFDFEIGYSVSEYAKDDDPEMSRGNQVCFDRVETLGISKLRQDAMAYLIDEMEILTIDELTTNDILFTDITFEEFDSPNWVHAAGYFNVSVYTMDMGFGVELETRYKLKTE